MRYREILIEGPLLKKPLRKPALSPVDLFVDKQGREITFVATKRGKHFPEDPDASGTIYARYDGKEIGYVWMQVHYEDLWRGPNAPWVVARTWIDEGFRGAGIGRAMYDFAFRQGFRPLKGSSVQTDGGAGLWRDHLRKKLASHGDFFHHEHPNRHHWWPLDLPRPPEKRGGRR